MARIRSFEIDRRLENHEDVRPMDGLRLARFDPFGDASGQQ